jgi:hypothetical protein
MTMANEQRCIKCALKERAKEKLNGIPVQEDVVGVSVLDLEDLLLENRHLRAQVTELQQRGTELIQAARAWKEFALACHQTRCDSQHEQQGTFPTWERRRKAIERLHELGETVAAQEKSE